MNVYEKIPQFGGDHLLLREVFQTDAEDLLTVYSDTASVPLFNSDNCNGDDFHYTTIEQMSEAVSFWLFSYQNRYFVRWAVIDKATDTAIGSIELFHRDSEQDIYDNCGLLRIDLRSDFEKQDIITELLSLIKDTAYNLFDCDKLATKIPPSAAERIAAVTAFGFKPSPEPLVGHHGEKFYDYYLLLK